MDVPIQNQLEVLYIELTSKCNLNCVHCGNDDDRTRSLKYDLVKKLLQDFNKNKGDKLMFTGGEPLLYSKLKDVLDIATSYDLLTKLSTNGYLLTDPKFDYLFDYDIGFKVSLDGNRKAHNKIRGNPKSYDNLISAMRKVSENNLELTVRSTLMKPNQNTIVDMLYDLDKLTEEESIKIDRVNIWPVRKIGHAEDNLLLSPAEYNGFLEDLNQRTREFKPSFEIVVRPMFGKETEFVGGPIKSDDIYTCNLLKKTAQIASNGDVYPCSFVHHVLGNISDESIIDIFNSDKARQFRGTFLERKGFDCKGCSNLKTCGGGCVAETHSILLDPLSSGRAKDIYCSVGNYDD